VPLAPILLTQACSICVAASAGLRLRQGPAPTRRAPPRGDDQSAGLPSRPAAQRGAGRWV